MVFYGLPDVVAMLLLESLQTILDEGSFNLRCDDLTMRLRNGKRQKGRCQESEETSLHVEYF